MEWVTVKALSNYGALGVILGVLLYGFYKLLKWNAAQQERREKIALDREDAMRKIIDDQINALNAHTQSAEKSYKSNDEAHKEMIEVLGRINGYKKVRRKK